MAQSSFDRFTAIAGALREQSSRWADHQARWYGAMASVSCSGEPTAVAQGVLAVTRLLKQECPWHWGVSGVVQSVVAALLLQNGDRPDRFVRELVRVRPRFREHKLHRALQWELLAVLILRLQAAREPIAAGTVARFARIYGEMKHHHRWLTGPDDFPACAILTGQSGEPREIGAHIEQIYQTLRHHKFSAGDPLQSAANIMYLGEGDAQDVARRAVLLRETFRQQKVRIGASGYGQLAMLALLPLPAEPLVAHVLMLRETLRGVRPRVPSEHRMPIAVGLSLFDVMATAPSDLATKVMLDTHLVVAVQQAVIAATAANAAVIAAT